MNQYTKIIKELDLTNNFDINDKINELGSDMEKFEFLLELVKQLRFESNLTLCLMKEYRDFILNSYRVDKQQVDSFYLNQAKFRVLKGYELVYYKILMNYYRTLKQEKLIEVSV